MLCMHITLLCLQSLEAKSPCMPRQGLQAACGQPCVPTALPTHHIVHAKCKPYFEQLACKKRRARRQRLGSAAGESALVEVRLSLGVYDVVRWSSRCACLPAH